MKRIALLSFALVIGGLILIEDVYGHGDLVRYGKKRKTGESWRCVSGKSRTTLYTHWKQSDLYSTHGNKHARNVNPDNHYHTREFRTWKTVGRSESGYRGVCDVRVTHCPTKKKSTYLGECHEDDIAHPDGDRCHWSDNDAYDEIKGVGSYVEFYDVEYVKKDPSCRVGSIID